MKNLGLLTVIAIVLFLTYAFLTFDLSRLAL